MGGGNRLPAMNLGLNSQVNTRSLRWTAFFKPILMLNNKGRTGCVIILFFILMAIFAPIVSPYSPTKVFTPWLPPNSVHWLGTDNYGQDVLSQLLYGSRASLVVGILSGLLSGVIGVIVGLASGYLKGIVSEVLMRLVDLLLVIPTLALIIIIGAFLPSEGQITQILVIGGLSWLWMARSIRSQVMSERAKGYVEVARITGMGRVEIMVREILPNVASVIVANLVMVITAAILVQASLNFLGIGSPNALSWGTMLSLGFTDNAIIDGAYWWIVPPGLAIALLGYGFVLIGNAILERFSQTLEG